MKKRRGGGGGGGGEKKWEHAVHSGKIKNFMFAMAQTDLFGAIPTFIPDKQDIRQTDPLR